MEVDGDRVMGIYESNRKVSTMEYTGGSFMWFQLTKQDSQPKSGE